MTARILDGKQCAREICQDAAIQAAEFVARHGFAPGLAVVQVGSDPASAWYVRQISRTFERAGLHCELVQLESETGETALQERIRALNADERTNGIIVQLPLPAPLTSESIVSVLDPAKDVDGIHPLNAGRLLQNTGDAPVPATPLGGIVLLERYGVEMAGKRAVVIGRSNIVGRPMSLLLLHRNATVTICHSRTQDVAAIAREADILVAAVGRCGFVTGEMIKPGAAVIDFGINVVGDVIVGDVDAEAAMDVAGWYTPVPGGTGPMTNAMLLMNTISAAQRQLG